MSVWFWLTCAVCMFAEVVLVTSFVSCTGHPDYTCHGCVAPTQSNYLQFISENFVWEPLGETRVIVCLVEGTYGNPGSAPLFFWNSVPDNVFTLRGLGPARTVLNLNNGVAFLQCEGGEMYFEDFAIVNGPGWYGSVCRSMLGLCDVTFTNVVVSDFDNDGSDDGHIFFLTNGHVTCINCQFLRLPHEGRGGILTMVNTAQTATFINCVFSEVGCTDSCIASVESPNAELVIQNAVISKVSASSVADTFGTLVSQWVGSTALIQSVNGTNCVGSDRLFSTVNTIQSSFPTTLSITDSVFMNNVVDDGLILCQGVFADSQVSVVNSAFHANTLVSGAVIETGGGCSSLTLSHVFLSGSRQAVFIGGSPLVQVTESVSCDYIIPSSGGWANVDLVETQECNEACLASSSEGYQILPHGCLSLENALQCLECGRGNSPTSTGSQTEEELGSQDDDNADGDGQNDGSGIGSENWVVYLIVGLCGLCCCCGMAGALYLLFFRGGKPRGSSSPSPSLTSSTAGRGGKASQAQATNATVEDSTDLRTRVVSVPPAQPLREARATPVTSLKNSSGGGPSRATGSATLGATTGDGQEEEADEGSAAREPPYRSSTFIGVPPPLPAPEATVLPGGRTRQAASPVEHASGGRGGGAPESSGTTTVRKPTPAPKPSSSSTPALSQSLRSESERSVIKVSLPENDGSSITASTASMRRKLIVSMTVSATDLPALDATAVQKGGPSGVRGAAGPLAGPAVSTGSVKKKVNIEVDTSMEVLNMDDPNVVRVAYLGAGMFGEVYHYNWNFVPVAVKILSKVTQSSVQDFVEEAQMLATLRCPYIVAYVGLCVDPLAIVTEFMGGGDLAQYLKSVSDGERSLDYGHHCSIALDILRGLVYLHSRGVAHRDLKPANVLLTTHFDAKIADFGLAGTKVRDLSGAGTPRYAAPEVLAGKEGDLPADLYGYGCILFETLTLVKPFASIKSAAERLEGNLSPADVQSREWAFPAHDAKLKAVLKALWNTSPAKRTPATEVILVLAPLLGS